MKSINITTISYLQHPRLINVPMVFPLYCYVKLVMDLLSPLHRLMFMVLSSGT